MCNPQKFGVHFKLNVACVDKEHNIVIPLIARKKGFGIIPPVGMHIFFNKFDVEITGISAPYSFDVVTCRCQIYKPLVYEQVIELLKLGWKEDVEPNGKHHIEVVSKVTI
jgi:hypothetical protein